MIPESRLSTEVVARQFWFPRNIPRQTLIDYEYGGNDLNDASDGLRVKVWKGEYLEGAIVLSAQGVTPVSFLLIANVKDFAFTFDRNMNPFIAYELEDNAGAFFYWFDTLVSGYVTTQLPVGSITPRCAHDDNRDLQSAVSDIILAYVRSGSLYFRAQRERYETEHLLSTEAGPGGLIQVGMNKALRFQFQLATASS